MNIYDLYLTSEAKTQRRLTIFEHSNDVLQVANYLLEQNSGKVQYSDLVRAGALAHDVGKIERDFRNGQWIHAPHSAKYLGPLLEDPRFHSLLGMAGVDLAVVDRDLLLAICEEHHNPSPNLLRQCKDALLISIADALASSIEAGTVGNVAAILRSNPYLQVSLQLVRSLGFDKGFDTEFHRIDLPGQFVEDLFLASMIFRMLASRFREAGVYPLLQKGASLWIVAAPKAIHSVLAEFTVDPRQLYESIFEERIYDSILDELLTAVPAGAMQVDSMKYVLVNEPIARRLAIALCTRKSVRTLLEKHNLSHLADKADEVFANGLVAGIEALWRIMRLKLLELAPALSLPESVTSELQGIADGQVSRSSIALVKPNKDVLKALKTRDRKLAKEVEEFLKLFDASGNYYRSITNVLLELLKMQAGIAAGIYSLPLTQTALLDGQPLVTGKPVKNKALCPVCRRFPQELVAQSLITGNPKMDSVYQTFRGTRGQIRVCRWCFLVGYVDLPIANITKDGQSINKGREYLLFTSPLSKEKLQWLVDFVRQGRAEATEGGDQENSTVDAAELAELEAMMGLAGGYDELAVLGISRQRLSNLKGFVLPMVNVLNNLVGIRLPVERLVGEDKVSGAVRRELVKATMHDLHLATGATSIHYNVVTEAQFSVDGQPITLEEIRRASVAYRIANRYARFGRYWQLNSGIFMLLLSNTRQAVTLVLRARRRESGGQYAPGEDRIKEVIELAESIAPQDWKFDLGLKIVSTLVEVGLTPKARGFRYGPRPRDVHSGHDLVKWLQRIKMIRDETSARAWGTMLINALKRGDLAYKEYIQDRGGQIGAPGEGKIRKILDLVEEIVATCAEHKCKLSEFSRDIADMDYYLLFYHNQKAKEAKQ